MTIRSVRIYYYPRQKRRQKWLTANYWGWAEWFERRLKPIREELGGPEVKGVDVVNLMLREDASHTRSPDTWVRALNTLQFEFVCDLGPLIGGDKIANLERLMGFYATVANSAPWPQLKSVAGALAAPLNAEDRSSLEPFLHWPRKVGRIARFAS